MNQKAFIIAILYEFFTIWNLGRKTTLHLECYQGEATISLQTYIGHPVTLTTTSPTNNHIPSHKAGHSRTR
jgi:hypothetical protein